MPMLGTLAYPAIDPVFFEVGPFSVRWYGLAYIAGFLVATWVFARLNRRWVVGLTSDDILTALLYCVIGVIVGGRLGYVIAYGAGGYWQDPLAAFAIWDGGMSWHGGFVGIIVAGLLLSRRLGVEFLTLADMAAVGAPVGFFFGRIANFINNELWGRVTDVSWAMVPPGQTVARHPSQLYEALLEGLVMFLVLLYLSRRRRGPGFFLGMFMALYGVFRFAVEFVREPDVQLGYLLGWMTMGQLLSAPLIALGVWVVWRSTRVSSEETDIRA